jgi:hypothetical protein
LSYPLALAADDIGFVACSSFCPQPGVSRAVISWAIGPRKNADLSSYSQIRWLILASSSIRQRRVACSFFMVLILGRFISVSPYRYVMQILRAGKWDFRFFTLSGCDGADAGFQQ